MNKEIKILVIAGTRPNFIKIAPLFWEFKKYPTIQPILVHTGQHYDYQMSKSFFKELSISAPDYNLEVGSDSHARQTAKIMLAIEPVVLKEKPHLVIVVGDVNSTLAGALVVAKLNIPIAHIEAGLRSFDNSMPEEINRKLTDQISDFLFVTEPSGVKNLLQEGIAKEKIHLVGNIMIDTLKSQILNLSACSRRAGQAGPQSQKYKLKILKKLNPKKENYAVLTLHRPNNVDNLDNLNYLFEIFAKIQKKIKIIFPVHPRTRQTLKLLPKDIISKLTNLKLTNPLGYLDFITLVSQAKFVITDSGGLQEETTFLKIPCLTLRKNTERPITVTQGTNILCHSEKEIMRAVRQILQGKIKRPIQPKFWDGRTAERIIKILLRYMKYENHYPCRRPRHAPIAKISPRYS